MSGVFEAEFPANPEQAEYWNTVMAEKWVANQAAIDARFVPLTELLVTRSDPGPGERVMDIGCGTGATLLALAERVAPHGAVLGVDISRPMLALAEQRIRAAGHAAVTVRLADAQTATFAREGFDLLASRFGVMFFQDPLAAFQNLLPALRRGGRLAFICWTQLESNPWFALPLEVGVRHLGEPEPQPDHAPGPFAFGDAAYVEEVLARAGFTDIAIARVESTISGGADAAEEARFACHMGPLARLIRERAANDETLVARIEDEVAGRFRPFETDAGVRMPATIFFVTARRG